MTKKPGRRPQNALTGSELRSWIMSRVPQKGTSPEMVLRFGLHRLGFRFRVANRGLPGSPDIVLPKYRTAIFVHGCFWHRHGCRRTTTPKSNVSFWEGKFEANVRRDHLAVVRLLDGGWRVLTVWECILKTRDRNERDRVVEAVAEWLRGGEAVAYLPSPGVSATTRESGL
jgi:DNA mismatch endonuclease (patch repair protein)